MRANIVRPLTSAENFALHLKMNYGLQLDFARHSALVQELEGFANAYGDPSYANSTFPVNTGVNSTAPGADSYANPMAPEVESYANPSAPVADLYANPTVPGADSYANPAFPEAESYGAANPASAPNIGVNPAAPGNGLYADPSVNPGASQAAPALAESTGRPYEAFARQSEKFANPTAPANLGDSPAFPANSGVNANSVPVNPGANPTAPVVDAYASEAIISDECRSMPKTAKNANIGEKPWVDRKPK